MSEHLSIQSEYVPTPAPAPMPGQLAGPVPNAPNCFYWHEKTGREIIDRYVTGRGYGVGEEAQVSEIEQFRRPIITLNDWPDCPWDTMKMFWPAGKPKPAGLLIHAVQPQLPCYVYCNPGQWDTLCALFIACGYDVKNADAPDTPFRK